MSEKCFPHSAVLRPAMYYHSLAAPTMQVNSRHQRSSAVSDIRGVVKPSWLSRTPSPPDTAASCSCSCSQQNCAGGRRSHDNVPFAPRARTASGGSSRTSTTSSRSSTRSNSLKSLRYDDDQSYLSFDEYVFFNSLSLSVADLNLARLPATLIPTLMNLTN